MSEEGVIDEGAGRMSDEVVVSTENLCFSYGSISVLQGVDLTIKERDFVWIVGPNGGGKTTLLKLIIGLLEPSGGSVRVFGGPPRGAGSRIGYMAQQIVLDTQFPVNVRDVVLMGRLHRGIRLGFYGAADKQAAEHALEMVGLADKARRPFAELSGGQQRRLFVARALACEPELLVLDEPTANLDQGVQRELYGLLRRLSERLTVVMVSHDPAFVSEFVKHVVCVKGTVDVHPTGEVSNEMLGEWCSSGDMRIVRHDRQYRGGEPNG